MTTWSALLGDHERDEEQAAEPGFFGRLRDSLGKSRRALTGRGQHSVDRRDDEAWERLEEALIAADVGVPATAELVQRLEARGVAGDLIEPLVEEASSMLGEPGTLSVREQPSVLLVVGVNGTGKTTTIGKLAYHLNEHGRSVIVAAADTFRAAAEEQLEIWAKRAEADFVGSERGGDPAAVAYDAIGAATARGRDVAIVDTAVRQAQLFGEAVQVTGVALTKLDGSAKGGVALAIAHELGLPVKLVGVGEGIEDLRPFNPREFAQALLTD